MPQPAAGRQGIHLRTAFFVLDWTLNFTRTTVIIDGQVHDVPWGEHFFQLEPGQHDVQVSYRYLGAAHAGKASAVIGVEEGQVVPVSYRAPRSVLVAFRPGKLAAQPVR
jgi:hypothetical protein